MDQFCETMRSNAAHACKYVTCKYYIDRSFCERDFVRRYEDVVNNHKILKAVPVPNDCIAATRSIDNYINSIFQKLLICDG